MLSHRSSPLPMPMKNLPTYSNYDFYWDEYESAARIRDGARGFIREGHSRTEVDRESEVENGKKMFTVPYQKPLDVIISR